MTRIDELRPDEYFVFGSNLLGQHLGGAARDAHRLFSAEMGIGEGITGQCYALPTLDTDFAKRSLEDIQASVWRLFQQARNWPHRRFLITPVGCGIAGFTTDQIAPLFKGAPANCIFLDDWNK